MKYFRFLVILLVAATLTFTACGDNGSGTTYAIGDTGPSGVGIVFYITDGGLHGLEVAPSDQSTGVTWSNIPSTLIGTTGTAIGTGFDNTEDIIGQGSHTASAALTCRNYRTAEEGDWFLPSKDELNAIWDNLVDDGAGNNNGVGGFANNYYWSSSEDTFTIAWSQDFLDGVQDDSNKNFILRVRAVRAF